MPSARRGGGVGVGLGGRTGRGPLSAGLPSAAVPMAMPPAAPAATRDPSARKVRRVVADTCRRLPEAHPESRPQPGYAATKLLSTTGPEDNVNEPQLVAEITPLLAQFDLELDALDVRPAGRRTLLRITVDGDGPDGRGPSLDDIAEATRAISRRLDESSAVGNNAFTLEVSSRGVSAPLVRPEHWRRNLDRLVRVRPRAGADRSDEPIEGRISGVTDDAALISVDGTETRIPFEDVEKATVQVELSKKRPTADAAAEEE